MSDIAVEVCGIWKKFHRGEFHDSLRDLIPALAKRLAGRGPRRDELAEGDFWALRDVSFEVRRGEVLGLVGANGAGKSTLLKVLAKIIRPNRGCFRVNGRLRALIEIAAGFHPDLTGRENIYLNGSILGMRKKEIDAKFDEIVAFAGIDEFLDTPVKRYSSGMFARLGFAVAAHLEPEILLVDEVLAVGDAAFQAKCLGKMRHVAGEGRTVIFVSHNMKAVTQLCTRAVALERGRVVMEGPAQEVVTNYLTKAFDLKAVGCTDLPDDPESPLVVRRIKIAAEDGIPGTLFPRSKPLCIDIEGEVRRPGRYIVALDVRTLDDVLLFRTHSFEQDRSFGILDEVGPFRLRCTIPGDLLPGGKYIVGLVTAERGLRELQNRRAVLEFDVYQDAPLRGSDIMSCPGLLTPHCLWERTD
ncbi:MAG: ATP-binding cassette domain-containing protein [Planctomycetota bacterium]|nr:MAG: ATP-binding cassette domain-containing protein [Planctomycetota bacterium]